MRSSAISDPGPTSTTRCDRAFSWSDGWAARAAPSIASLGTKQTTISGPSRKPDQYSLSARADTCRPRLAACSRSNAARSSSARSSPWASRKDVIGALASMTRTLSPGSRTTTSGRTPRPCALTEVTCSSKSQRASIPEASSTRRSCTSPQAPRTVEERSEPASEAVWRPRCWVSPSTRASRPRRAPNCCMRSRSSVPTWCSTRTSASLSGASSAAVSRSSARDVSRSTTRSRRRSRSATTAAERAASTRRPTTTVTAMPMASPSRPHTHVFMSATLARGTDRACEPLAGHVRPRGRR